MSGAKTIVSTALEPEDAERLDAFCAKIHRTRAEVIRGLLYALLVEGKQFIYEDWRKEV
jgi:predicted DNA-binding protein